MFFRYKQFNFTIRSLLPEIQLIPTEEVTCERKKADTKKKKKKLKFITYLGVCKLFGLICLSVNSECVAKLLSR